jgi:branched-chain amino acid transport system substrate-binding protein
MAAFQWQAVRARGGHPQGVQQQAGQPSRRAWLGLVLGVCVSACQSKEKLPESNGAAPSTPSASSSGPAGARPGDPRPIKIGVLAPFSGPFAGSGKQIEGGIRAYLDQHAGHVAGHAIELLIKDTTGVAPDVAKREAQGLIVRDKVDFLAGFVLTPNAMAVAPLASEAKKPLVIMNAATSSITTKSPYVVRVSFTLPQVSAPLATWAAKNGIKSVYTLVSDYAPGADAEAQFKKTFEAAGGKIIDSVRVPVQNPEFSPYIQRLKDAKPDAVFLFVPAGAQGVAFMKAFQERGLGAQGIKVLATGDVTEDQELNNMGDAALGVVSTHQYSAAHESAENTAFKASFAKVTGGQLRANFMAVGGYDGMAAIAQVVEKLAGDPKTDLSKEVDGDRALEFFKGLELKSPRGPIRIDPETRDIIQTVYVRRVERREGELYNVEFDQFLYQKDPGK